MLFSYIKNLLQLRALQFLTKGSKTEMISLLMLLAPLLKSPALQPIYQALKSRKLTTAALLLLLLSYLRKTKI